MVQNVSEVMMTLVIDIDLSAIFVQLGVYLNFLWL